METTENETKTSIVLLEEFRSLEVYKYDVIERAAEAIEAEVMSEVVDITKKKGRDREGSLALKVSKAKQRVIKMANESIQEAKDTVKGVTTERKRLEDLFDGIRDKRKAASIAWDLKNEERKAGHRNTILNLTVEAHVIECLSIEELDQVRESINGVDLDSLQEFTEEGARVHAGSLGTIPRQVSLVKQREAQAAELARLQKVEADAKEAAEKRAAEDEARRVADEAAAAKIVADKKAAADKLVADAMAKKDELARIAAEKQAVIDAQKFAEEQKEHEKQQAVEREAAAVEREKAAAAAAVKAEQKRQAEKLRAEAAAAEAEGAIQRKREENKRHRTAVKDKAYKSMINQGINKDEAFAIVLLIEAGKIDKTSLDFS